MLAILLLLAPMDSPRVFLVLAEILERAEDVQLGARWVAPPAGDARVGLRRFTFEFTVACSESEAFLLDAQIAAFRVDR